MPLVLTIAQAAAVEIVDKVAGLHALKVAKAQATRQVTQIAATPVEVFVGAAKAAAKDHVLEAALVVLKEADFHFGWEAQTILALPTVQTLTTMFKRLTLICLLLLAVAGVKAQTYCYHCYQEYDKFDVPKPKDGYTYFTFKGDFIYFSKKDGSYQDGYDGKPKEMLYKFFGYSDAALVYKWWCRDFYMEKEKYTYSNAHILLVSKDKTKINYIFKGSKFVDACTTCFERCPYDECEKPHVPAMKE